jgi:hypothetical protein
MKSFSQIVLIAAALAVVVGMVSTIPNGKIPRDCTPEGMRGEYSTTDVMIKNIPGCR